MIKILCSLVIWISSSIAFAQSSLVVLGDSLSAGYGVDLGRGWVVLLQKKIDQSGLNIQVHNASISGDTSAGGVARIDQVLATIHPEWLLLELGANDGLRGLSPMQMETNLKTIITHSQQAGAKVILFAIKIPPNYGKRYVHLFEQVYPKLAEELHIPLLPFFLEKIALKPELMQKDRLHPNTIAQPFILENIWSVLEKYLVK
ncbi:MAG: hypothetical protein RL637_903 [Pseudomonadota bacterium]|jgi:acyl-CoA thioesterase-1